MKKYELTSETKSIYGRTLYRIRALISFNDVKAGDLGGWIEKERNLSQEGNAWVSGNAHILTVGPIGSRNAATTFCHTKGKTIAVTCGCFRGTTNELLTYHKKEPAEFVRRMPCN